MASRNIRVNCVLPGFVETAMTHGITTQGIRFTPHCICHLDRMTDTLFADIDPETRRRLLQHIPLGRFGTAAVPWLLSSASFVCLFVCFYFLFLFFIYVDVTYPTGGCQLGGVPLQSRGCVSDWPNHSGRWWPCSIVVRLYTDRPWLASLHLNCHTLTNQEAYFALQIDPPYVGVERVTRLLLVLPRFIIV